VGHLEGDVDVEGPAVDRVHELGERPPVPGQALGQHDAGDVLDTLHQLDEPVVVLVVDGGEADAAVADDDGGDAVPRRGDHALAPRGLAVVVGVDVDEAGRYQQPVGVDGAGGGAVDPTHLGDDAVADRDVGGAGGGAGAVEDGPAPDDQLVLAHWRTLRAARNELSALRAGYRTVFMIRSLRSLISLLGFSGREGVRW
jgi:hypothetical protein